MIVVNSEDYYKIKTFQTFISYMTLVAKIESSCSISNSLLMENQAQITFPLMTNYNIPINFSIHLSRDTKIKTLVSNRCMLRQEY